MKTKRTFLVINQTAGSPYHGMVYRNYYLAKEWVKQGHNAIIISSSNFHNFHSPPKCKGLFTQEFIDGIEYWWVRMPPYSQSKSLGRLFSIFLFPLLLLLFPFRKISKPNTIIVSGPPHVPIINAWIWSRFTAATLVYEVRDIWPLTIQKLGGVKAWHPIILVFSFFERMAYLLSDRVVSVLVLAYRHFEQKGMLPAKFAFISNGIELSSYLVTPNETGKKIAEISQNKFTIIYAGSFGIANHLDQLMDVAESLKDRTDVAFILLGNGPHKDNLISRMKGNSSVYFFPHVPKEQIPYILRQANIGFIGFVKTDLYKFGVSPNKIFDYMAAELPILMVLDSDDDIVEKSKSGITVRSGETLDIKNAILKLKNLAPEELKELGINGRKYLEENHTYRSLAEKYIKVAEEGRRPVEESARWVASPFWVGFNIVIVLGLMTHFLFPAIAPHLFHNGIITFLKDPHTYHQIALKAVDLPWIEFSFRPEGQFPAGILALIYKLTGIHKPFMLLPILAVLAGLSIRGIVSCLDVLGVKGRWWPIIIGLLFTITPTSISWMIYPHKDAFIVPGVILIAWTFMAVTLRRIRLRHVLSLILGSILVFTSKPYFAELFAVGAALAIPFAWRQPASQLGRYGRLSFLMIALFLFGAIAYLKKGYSDACEGVPQNITNNQNSVPTKDSLPRHIQTKANWKSLPLGLSLNKALLALAYTRERFLFQRSHGNTNFLSEIHLEGAWDTIKFIPKALQLSLFEPLPWRQVEGGMARKLIFLSAQLEMLLVYFSIFFLIASGKKSWSPAVIICIALAVPFLIALGFAAPNIGAINRYRFPFLVLIKIAGFAALWNSNRFKWPGRLLMWVDPPRLERKKNKVMFLVPDDQTFVIQRLVMAQGIQKAGYEVHVACPDIGHAASIRELGFIHHHIDLNRGGLNPLADFKAFIKLVFFLAKERPDILHNVSIKPVIYGATAGSIVGLKRIVCLINGLGYAFEAKTFKGKLVLYVAKALYKNALALPGVRVIFQNPDDREYFIKENLVEEHKTILIRGSGVNTKKFYPTPQPQNLKPVVLFVGRLLRSKGVEDLISAARILKNEKIDFDLQFVGEPDERNPESLSWTDLKKIEDEGLCKLLGRQNDMPHFYREADIVVLPQQNREGLPLTLLEASSSARSIVTTDVPGCREVVLDQVNGLKVPPMNPEKLANAIRILIENPQMRERFGRSGAEIVQKEFSANIIEAQLVKVYESLLNDSVPLNDNQVLCPATS